MQEEREDREDVNHTEIAELKSQEESIRSSTNMIQRSVYMNSNPILLSLVLTHSLISVAMRRMVHHLLCSNVKRK